MNWKEFSFGKKPAGEHFKDLMISPCQQFCDTPVNFIPAATSPDKSQSAANFRATSCVLHTQSDRHSEMDTVDAHPPFESAL